MTGPRVEVAATSADLAGRAAEIVITAAQEAAAAQGRFAIALSGGRTPRMLYRRLAHAGPSALPYDRTHIFWSDERAVPPGDEYSNFRLAHAVWLAQVSIPAGQVHRIRGEDDPDVAAGRYEDLIRNVLGDPPRFDLILLGVGRDGHTASLFPGAPPPPAGRLVVRATAPAHPRRRITFTPELIALADRVLVLVSGAEKARAVRRALQGPPSAVPAGRLRGPRVHWLLDADAAALLEDPPVQPCNATAPAAT